MSLWEHSTEVLNWFDSSAGRMYLEYLSEKLISLRRKLEKETEPAKIYRTQGFIEGILYAGELPAEIRRVLVEKAGTKVPERRV